MYNYIQDIFGSYSPDIRLISMGDVSRKPFLTNAFDEENARQIEDFKLQDNFNTVAPTWEPTVERDSATVLTSKSYAT